VVASLNLTQTLANVIDELPPDGYRYQYFGLGLGLGLGLGIIGNASDKVLSFFILAVRHFKDYYFQFKT
jgi:hypothetical protein